jgi:choline dehydrogenase-like flavoprotein
MSPPAATAPMEATVRMEADVLIIGSGAGGATTAAVLAEAGHDVLVVEEGEWVEQGAVVPFSLEQMDRQYRAGGVTVAVGVPSVAYTEGRCAGGGTEVNSGLYKEPPHDVIERWRDDFAIRDLDLAELDGISAEVVRDLHVTTLPGRPPAASEAMRRGAAALGWSHGEIPRWMVYDSDDPASAQRQSMTRTYLPRAMRAGARMVTGCRVHRLLMHRERAQYAETTLADGRRGFIRFRSVFVCGGAIQTPAILQRSGLRRLIGSTLAVHPTVKLAARFVDEINVPDDVPVHQVKEFAPNLSFGGSASHPGLVALALSDHWAAFKGALPDWRRISVYYAAITSEGRGKVRAVPGLRDPVVTYSLTRRDRDLLGTGLSRLALLMLEAGATDVFPSFRNAPLVKNRRGVADMAAHFSAAKASVMSVHLCSTVPLGENRQRCAADSYGRVHGTTNVYVNDASLLPTAPGVNPQATVMALSIRNARRFHVGYR